MEIADQRQCRAEREVLKAPRERHKGLQIALCAPDELFEIQVRREGNGLYTKLLFFSTPSRKVQGIGVGLRYGSK